MIKPTCLMERLFLQAALSKLPLYEAEVDRNSHGMLCFKWISPCKELEALWVSVTAYEITLSCAIVHSHIDRTNRSFKKKITNLQTKRCIARDAVRQVSLFLDSQIAATITYDEQGKKYCSGWCPQKQLASSLEYTRKVFGHGMAERAWVWSGEVEVA